ncbi:MAG: hypothetical protein ABUL55_02860 [Pseudomonadota bacterium]
MKLKHIAGVGLTALMLGAALPATAQDYGRAYDRGYGDHDGWRGRGEIRVRTPRADFAVSRGDRLFYRLTDEPYNFRPGFTYVYTDRCDRGGCDVLVLRDGDRRPVAHVFAPRISFEFAGRDDRGEAWRGDDHGAPDRDQYEPPPQADTAPPPPPDDQYNAPPQPDDQYGAPPPPPDDQYGPPPSSDDQYSPPPSANDGNPPYDDNSGQPDPDCDLEGGPNSR